MEGGKESSHDKRPDRVQHTSVSRPSVCILLQSSLFTSPVQSVTPVSQVCEGHMMETEVGIFYKVKFIM